MMDFKNDMADIMRCGFRTSDELAADSSAELALIEKALEKVGISSLLNHGAASCVFTEGCCGVSQEHIVAYTREIALHCAIALSAKGGNHE